MTSLTERLRSKTQLDARSGCWNWTATKNKRGYGKLWAWGKVRQSHRVSYELHHGSLPQEMRVLHRCDNPSCVNPDHLFLGTDADNVADRDAKGRQQRGGRHYRAKLTEDDVLSIRTDKNTSRRLLAEKFGVTKASIAYIKNGKTWKHVTSVTS